MHRFWRFRSYAGMKKPPAARDSGSDTRAKEHYPDVWLQGGTDTNLAPQRRDVQTDQRASFWYEADTTIARRGCRLKKTKLEREAPVS